MLRNLFTFLLALCFVSSTVLLGQTLDKSKAVKNFKADRERVVQNQNKLKKTNQNTSYLSTSKILKFDKVAGLIDTFSYRKWLGGDWTNGADGFGQSGQDVLVQWYQAPADLTIKAVGIGTATNDNNHPVSVKIVKLINYTAEDLALLNNTVQLGWYPSDGDGYNNIGPYVNDATGGATGDWVPVNDLPEPFGEDYWSDAGFGVTITPTPQPYEANAYDWVEMSALTFEPTVLRGEIFGISVSNTGNSPANPTGDRQAFWAAGNSDYPLLKFYEYTRTSTPDGAGWWLRPLALDFVAVVDIFGDEPPQFVEVDELSTTLSTEAREVTASITDRNPGGGASGVQSAILKYSLDGTTWSDVSMTNTGGDVWSGSIPGQSPGAVVKYYVEATDVGNTTNQSRTFEYRIYQPTAGINTLLVFNGFTEAIDDYPLAYYFGIDDFVSFETFSFDHDVWAYGALTTDLVNSYTNILEITSSANGPADYNDDVIREWINASGTHNYMLAGQEWLGLKNQFTDSTYEAGSFEYDILGVLHSYNDISYDGTAGQLLPSKVTPIAGALLSDSLMAKWNNSTDSLNYDPAYEIAVANWVDGFDVVEGVVVDMTIESRGIGGEPAVETKNLAAHRTLTAGNKIAFLAYDPISVNTTSPSSNPHYYWYGFSSSAPQVQVLHWFGTGTDVKRTDNNIPNQFSLKQNYPNPFNPSTSIQYSIPVSGNVTLTIFDILGKKVTDLVNSYQQAGNFSATWNGTDQFGAKVTSGTYFYQLRTDNGFVKTEKMILLK